jgi:predicted nuclease with TOPRIM domain
MVQSQNNEIMTLSNNLDKVKEGNEMLNVRVHGHDILIEDLNGKVGGLKTENGTPKRRVEAEDAEMKTLIEKIDGLERENGSLRGKAELLVSTIDVLTSRVKILENHALGLGEGSDGKASSANTTSRGGLRGGMLTLTHYRHLGSNFNVNCYRTETIIPRGQT